MAGWRGGRRGAVRKNMSCVGSNKCKAVSFGTSAPVSDVASSHSSLNSSFVPLPRLPPLSGHASAFSHTQYTESVSPR